MSNPASGAVAAVGNLIPARASIERAVGAGVAISLGFATAGYIGAKVVPFVPNLKLPIVSSATLVRVAVAAVMGLVQYGVGKTKLGGWGLKNLTVGDVLFYATAGAAASAFGSLVVDLINATGTQNPSVVSAKAWVEKATGLA